MWLQGNQKPDDGRDEYIRRPVEEPAITITSQARSYKWCSEAPSMTVQGDPRIAPRGHHDRQFNGETVRVIVPEAGVLQSFRVDYPWHGSKSKQHEQVGNAIPPLLAAAILGHLLGMPWQHICREWYRPTASLDGVA